MALLRLGKEVGALAADGSVEIAIKADDSKFKSALAGVELATKKGVKSILGAVGAVSAALGGLAVYAIKSGAEYETSLAKVGTIADTSVKSLSELSKETLNLSNATGASASEINEALYSALSAGADTAHATDLVAVAVKSAKGGFTDTETAVDGLTSALNAYGMQTADAEGLANKFLVTQNLGKTTFGDLASSIGTVAPTAHAAGVSVDDLLASVASLTANGIGTSEAMTGMKAALSNVIKPTSDAQKMAKQLGIDFSAAALKSKGWAGFLQDIKEKTGGNTEQMSQLFGSVEALNSVLTLTSDNGMSLMNETLGTMKTDTHALDDAYNEMSDTLSNKVDVLKTNFKNLGIVVSQQMSGTVVNAVGKASGYVSELGTVMSAAFANNATKEQAAALSDQLEKLGYSSQEASGMIGSGMSGVVSSLGGIVAKAVNDLVQAAPTMVNAGVQLISALLQGISKNAPQFASGALSLIASLAQGIVTLLPQIAQTGTDIIVQLAQGVAQAAPTMIPKAVEVIGQLIQGLASNLDQIVSSGIDMLVSLGEGLIKAIPQLITQIPKIVISIADAINNNGAKMLMSAAKLLLELGVGLIKAIPTLIKNIPAIIEAIVKAFLAFGWLGLGKSLIKGIASGIKGAASFAKTAAKGIGDAIKKKIGEFPSKLLTVGKDLVQGIANGIKAGAKWAVDAIKDLGKSMLNGIKDFFHIKSPSAVMRDEIGKNLVLGVADGVVDNQRVALDAMGNFSRDMLDTATGSLQQGLTDNMEEYHSVGAQMVTGLISGIASQQSGLIGGITSMVQGAVSAAQNALSFGGGSGGDRGGSSGSGSDFEDVGSSMGGSLSNGIKSGIAKTFHKVTNTVKNVVSGLVGSIKKSQKIHSPSLIWADIGSNMAAGVGVGFVDRLKNVGRDMQGAMTAETGKMSMQISAATSKQLAMDSAQSRVETYYSNQVIEKTPVIEFKGDLAGLGRYLQPSIRMEERRQGGSLVKGG